MARSMCRSSAQAAVAALLLLGLGHGLYADVGSGASFDPIVGASNSDSCIPFNCDASAGYSTYQQVYASSAFAGVTPFNQISFSLEALGELDSGTYAISFSYTSQAVDLLSTVSPSANIGADETAFGTFVLAGGPAPSTLLFSGNTFDYNPTQGNLLMTISVSGAKDTGSPGSYEADYTGNVTSRAYFGGTNGADRTGLVTDFNDVPEPDSLMLLATCLLGLGAWQLLRRSPNGRSRSGSLGTPHMFCI